MTSGKRCMLNTYANSKASPSHMLGGMGLEKQNIL